MNANTIKLSAAIAFGLGIAFTSVTATAAMSAPQAKMHLMETGSPIPGQAKVIHLGTIQVTRADAEGVKNTAPAKLGSTAYVGSIQVTPADSPEARAAALSAKHSGAVYLGSITVTADDSEDARYAANQAAMHGSAYLGSIRVTPYSGKSPITTSLLAVRRYLGSHPTLAVIGTLVFARTGV